MTNEYGIGYLPRIPRTIVKKKMPLVIPCRCCICEKQIDGHKRVKHHLISEHGIDRKKTYTHYDILVTR